MKYILEEEVMVRKWVNKAVCRISGQAKPYVLDQDEYAFLKRCNGMDELEQSLLSDRLEALGVIRKSKGNACPLGENQFVEYPNYHVRYIDWTITERCNLNCLHCFQAADNNHHAREFSFEQAKRFLDDMKECGIRGVGLTGGEPTMYPYFKELLKEIHDRKMFLTVITTNGFLLDEELVFYIAKLHPRAVVRMSFDGIGYHDWMRQREGSEQRVIKAIKFCREAGLRVMINTNVNRRNREVMFDSLRMLDECGIMNMRIIRTSESPRWQMNKEEYSLTPQEYYDFSCDFAGKYKDSGIKTRVIIWQSLDLDGMNQSYLILPVKSKSGKCREESPICTAFFHKPSVQANGDLVPCAPMGGYFAANDIHLGNVQEASLKDLLSRGKYIETITKTVGEKMKENDKCRNCRYHNACQGGCPALSLALGGDIMASDLAKCIFFENGYYDRYCQALSGWKNKNPMEGENI